jgi:hypothetical protein
MPSRETLSFVTSLARAIEDDVDARVVLAVEGSYVQLF